MRARPTSGRRRAPREDGEPGSAVLASVWTTAAPTCRPSVWPRCSRAPGAPRAAEGTLTVGKRSAQFVRNQARVVIAGQACRPRRAGAHRRGRVARPRGVPRQGAAPARCRGSASVRGPDPKSAVRQDRQGRHRVRGAALSLLSVLHPRRGRDGRACSPTRVVTGRTRSVSDCPRLGLTGVRTEEIADGLVKEIRLEPLADGDAGAPGGARRPRRRRQGIDAPGSLPPRAGHLPGP